MLRSSHPDTAGSSVMINDRAAAYRRIREHLLKNPHDAAAWIEMSTLVDDLPRQRECLRRALALDPYHIQARERMESLRLKQLLTIGQPAAETRAPTAQKLGAYLVAQGYITALQLDDALWEQRHKRKHGEFVTLGDVLLERGWITPRDLARALIAQLQERLAMAAPPQLLGERLVVARLISLEQLRVTIEAQAQLRIQGQHVPLGVLLVRKGYVSREELEPFLPQRKDEG